MGLVPPLEKSCIFTPLDLAVLTYLESLALDNLYDSKGNIVLLWQPALFWHEKNPTRPQMLRISNRSTSKNMIRQLRVGSIPETSFYKDWGDGRVLLGLPKDFDHLPPGLRWPAWSTRGRTRMSLGTFYASEPEPIARDRSMVRFAAFPRALIHTPPSAPWSANRSFPYGGERHVMGVDYQAGRDL